VKFLPLGDTALTVEFAESIDRDTNAQVLMLDARITHAELDGVIEAVPTFRSLTVHYDPSITSAMDLQAEIEELSSTKAAVQTRERTWRIPVCYEGSCAPDLAEVAERLDLTINEVIEYHSSVRYFVYMIGFLPGLPYLGELPAEIDLPRRQHPRVRVPPGSVAIAAGLTTIYPYESPGGWHLLGRTPIPLFSLDLEPPSLLAPGDTVQFEPVSHSHHDRLSGMDIREVSEQFAERVDP